MKAEAKFTSAIHRTSLDDSSQIFTGENAATQRHAFNRSVKTEVKKYVFRK